MVSVGKKRYRELALDPCSVHYLHTEALTKWLAASPVRDAFLGELLGSSELPFGWQPLGWGSGRAASLSGVCAQSSLPLFLAKKCSLFHCDRLLAWVGINKGQET